MENEALKIQISNLKSALRFALDFVPDGYNLNPSTYPELNGQEISIRQAIINLANSGKVA